MCALNVNKWPNETRFKNDDVLIFRYIFKLDNKEDLFVHGELNYLQKKRRDSCFFEIAIYLFHELGKDYKGNIYKTQIFIKKLNSIL